MNGPDTPGTFTPRTDSKGFVGDQIDAFLHMLSLDVDIVDAFITCVSGKRMTRDLAALCIQTYWRRYAMVAEYQENRGAVITIQAAFRGMDDRIAVSRMAPSPQARPSDSRDAYSSGREKSDEEYLEFGAATKLQAVWRGHLARAFTDRLKWQSKSKLQRTFSWGKKNRAKKPGAKDGKGGIKERSAKEILDGAGVDSNKPKSTVKRSMSFDRFSRGVKSIVGSDKPSVEGAPAAMPTKSKQLLFILLQRGPNGLGLELDATNTVVNLVPGGAADTQGYFREGDTIASVDGIPLRGRLLQDVMDRNKNSYSFDVWRLTPVEPEPAAPKSVNPVRRAFSFDRKKR